MVIQRWSGFSEQRFVFNKWSDSLPHDVIHDVSGRVEDAARFLDLGLVFDPRLMAFGKADDLAKKLFIDLAEDVRAEDAEFIRAVRVVESTDERLEQ